MTDEAFLRELELLAGATTDVPRWKRVVMERARRTEAYLRGQR